MRIDICACIVCYHPDVKTLQQLVEFFSKNRVRVLLFFNSPPVEDFIGYEDVLILGTGDNVGIASAQKQLFTKALNLGFRYVISSDQDSIYPDIFISSMLSFKDQFPDAAVVCPGWVNSRKRGAVSEKQYVLDGQRMQPRVADFGEKLSHAISSGMFIDLSILNFSDFIDETLFIDWVDNDLCWRLVSNGYNIRYNDKTILHHDLGGAYSSFRGIGFTRRSSVRDYYIVRNAIYLFLRRSYCVKCKRYLFHKIITHPFLSCVERRSLFGHLCHFKLICRALYDGVLGHVGVLK